MPDDDQPVCDCYCAHDECERAWRELVAMLPLCDACGLPLEGAPDCPRCDRREH